jgi:hypothetical protein
MPLRSHIPFKTLKAISVSKSTTWPRSRQRTLSPTSSRSSPASELVADLEEDGAEPAVELTHDEKVDLLLEQVGQIGEQNNWMVEKLSYVLTVIQTAEAAIAASPMAKMMGQRRG